MEDSRIIELFFERNEAALREVSEKYGAYCASIARCILKNREEADECLNDTYMSAWDSIPPKKPTSLGAYLGKITRNHALNRIKFFSQQKRAGEPLSFDELDEFVSGKYFAEDSASEHELTSSISRFIRGLPPVKQKLFLGRYWEMCSHAELAKRLKMSENAVAASLGRTLKKLKKFLKEEGFEL